MQVYLFDIDGTLLSSGGAGKAAMDAALRSAFAADRGTDGVPFTGRTDRAIIRDLFHRHGIEENEANLQKFLTAYLGHLPDCLARHSGRVLPGVARFLELLHVRATVEIGLLTGNIREGARLKLGHFGLVDFFRFGSFGDEHFDRDDVARTALDLIRTRLGVVNPQDVWVIGDTPLDVQCARAIGARAAAVATGWHTLDQLAESRPDVLLADLSDPGPLLDSWSPSAPG
jgi:phosphoglycolate phosphatase-like HAD superfamily hydrolase